MLSPRSEWFKSTKTVECDWRLSEEPRDRRSFQASDALRETEGGSPGVLQGKCVKKQRETQQKQTQGKVESRNIDREKERSNSTDKTEEGRLFTRHLQSEQNHFDSDQKAATVGTARNLLKHVHKANIDRPRPLASSKRIQSAVSNTKTRTPQIQAPDAKPIRQIAPQLSEQSRPRNAKTLQIQSSLDFTFKRGSPGELKKCSDNLARDATTFSETPTNAEQTQQPARKPDKAPRVTPR